MVNPAIARRLPPGATKKKDSPPILSWDFLVVNHGDICSVLVTIMVIGVMFQATQNYCFPFMWMNHNVTSIEEVRSKPPGELEMLYKQGPLDVLNIIFYTVVMILLHAIIQEFGIDKIVKKFHLSRYRTSQFIESTHIALFSIFSFAFGTYVLSQARWLLFRQPELLWPQYPLAANTMTMLEKYFCIIQLSYWLHWYAELFLQRIKREEWQKRITYISLYIACTLGAYIFGYTRLCILLLTLQYLSDSIFHCARLIYNSERRPYASMLFAVWNAVFPVVRVVSIGIGMLVLLKPRIGTFTAAEAAAKEAHSNETKSQTVAGGDDITLGTMRRILSHIALAAIVIVNGWLLYNFLMFQMRRWQARGGGGGSDAAKQKLKMSQAQQKNRTSKTSDKNNNAAADSDGNAGAGGAYSSNDEKSPKTSPRVTTNAKVAAAGGGAAKTTTETVRNSAASPKAGCVAGPAMLENIISSLMLSIYAGQKVFAAESCFLCSKILPTNR